jgi:proteasome lid subunit RPN8/RPN11
VTLERVRLFRVPGPVAEMTEEALRKAGSEQYELFVLWAGLELGNRFNITDSYVPAQTSFRTDDGHYVRVDGPALHDLNIWLHEHKLKLAGQVHSHPGKAFHSETDDTFPIATALGSLSIVVPNFCGGGLRAPGVVGYRLSKSGWNRLPRDFVGRTVEFLS